MAEFIGRINQALDEKDGKPCLEQGQRKLTVAQVGEAVRDFEEWILKHSSEGDRVAALTQNRIEAVLLEWATYRAGCIWIGIPARERDVGTLSRLLIDFSPRLLILERFGPYGEIVFREDCFPSSEVAPPPGLEGSRFRVLERRKPQTQVAFKDIQRLRYTSGTSGEPKAIGYGDGTAFAILKMVSDAFLTDGPWVVVHGLPITWASGSLIAPVLCCGGKNVILESWNVREFARTVLREGNVLSLLTPRLIAELVRYSEVNGTAWARGLRRVLVAGNPMSAWTMRRAWTLFRDTTEFLITLGMTEASFPITLHRVESADVEIPEAPALVPLGPFTTPYEGSEIDSKTGEVLVRGDSVAPWIWKPARGSSGGTFERLEPPHRSGDRARLDGQVLHYLGPASPPWPASCPPPQPIEAIIDECPGVRRSRVDMITARGNGFTADLAVQPDVGSLDTARIRGFYRRHQSEGGLGTVAVGRIAVGLVPVTMSGKVRRGPSEEDGLAQRPTASVEEPNSGGAGGDIPPRGIPYSRWQDFDLSTIASEPLYYYIGAGLSIGAGLVGWNEMVCLIWAYLRHYEGAQSPPPCPSDVGEGNERFLDAFVRETIPLGDGGQVRVLSRESGRVPAEWRTLGRTALLNLLLRYRAPRVKLVSKNDEAVPDRRSPPRARPGAEPSPEDLTVQSLIWRSQCHGVLTTNYDTLLEHAFSLYQHGAALRSYRYRADFLRYILSNPRFILKLHGDINDIATLEFYPKGAWTTGGSLSDGDGRGDDLKKVYQAALNRGHLVYLGCGFRDETIRQLQQRAEPSGFCQIALMPREDLERQDTCEEIRKTSGPGIKFLTYDKRCEVREFMEEVVSMRSAQRRSWAACPEATDIHRQFFLSFEPKTTTRNISTEPWSCRGVVPPKGGEGEGPTATETPTTAT